MATAPYNSITVYANHVIYTQWEHVGDATSGFFINTYSTSNGTGTILEVLPNDYFTPAPSQTDRFFVCSYNVLPGSVRVYANYGGAGGAVGDVAGPAHASPVQNLGLVSKTTTSLTVSWLAPEVYSGTLNGYNVYYRVSGSGSSWSSGGSTAGTSQTISGLSIGTYYDVMVKAVTSTGESLFKDAYQNILGNVQTVDVTTPSAPGTPSASRGAASGTVDITWSAPGSNGGAPIDSYLVQYSTDGVTWSNAFTTGALSGSATGLTNGTAYTFRVLAHNSQGYGPASWSSNYATPGTAPDAPAAPNASVDDRKSTVSWVAPSSNGYAITSYVVQYTTDNGSSFTAAGSATAPSTSLLVSPLVGGTAYKFRVAAVNAVGQSGWSPLSAAVIPTGLPEAPPLIVATQIDADATNAIIKIEITPPAITGGYPIDNYRLETSYDNGVTWDVPEYPFVPDQTTPWYQVSEPFPVKTIIYRVAAITQNGTGPYSPSSTPITTTLPPPPGSFPDAPVILSVVPGNSSLVVNWDPPSNPGTGGSVSTLTYTVQYSTDGGLTWTTAP